MASSELSEQWPGIPSWLNVEALEVDRAAIQSLIEEGRAMEKMVEDYARRVFLVRCPTRLPLADGNGLPDDVFEIVERLSGSADLFDVVDDLSILLQACITETVDKVVAERPHWTPDGYLRQHFKSEADSGAA